MWRERESHGFIWSLWICLLNLERFKKARFIVMNPKIGLDMPNHYYYYDLRPRVGVKTFP